MLTEPALGHLVLGDGAGADLDSMARLSFSRILELGISRVALRLSAGIRVVWFIYRLLDRGEIQHRCLFVMVSPADSGWPGNCHNSPQTFRGLLLGFHPGVFP